MVSQIFDSLTGKYKFVIIWLEEITGLFRRVFIWWKNREASRCLSTVSTFIILRIFWNFLTSQVLLKKYFAKILCRDKPPFQSFIKVFLNIEFIAIFDILILLTIWYVNYLKFLQTFVQMHLREVPFSVPICLRIFNSHKFKIQFVVFIKNFKENENFKENFWLLWTVLRETFEIIGK